MLRSSTGGEQDLGKKMLKILLSLRYLSLSWYYQEVSWYMELKHMRETQARDRDLGYFFFLFNATYVHLLN